MPAIAPLHAHATHHWHALPDGRVQCDVCPRHCRLREGQRGLCFVRMRQGGEVVLTTYGRSSGFCVDPIEKKPLNHFLPGTSVLSFGTAGCNLACKFCQNWDISTSRASGHAWPTPRRPRSSPPRPRVSAAAASRSPTTTPSSSSSTRSTRPIACRELGLKAVAVTAGYVCPAPRAELFAHLDAANVDLKAFSDDFYRTVCAGRLAPVLETIEYVRHETRCWLELTTLVIPGLNDSTEELDALTRWVVEHLGGDVPLHFSAFHPDHRMRDRPPTPRETLRRARAIAIANGVRYAYVGNVRDPEGETTFCHACGEPLIVRDGYAIEAWALDADGRCDRCGTACAGVLEEQPGHWGPRRLPVRIEP